MVSTEGVIISNIEGKCRERGQHRSEQPLGSTSQTGAAHGALGTHPALAQGSRAAGADVRGSPTTPPACARLLPIKNSSELRLKKSQIQKANPECMPWPLAHTAADSHEGCPVLDVSKAGEQLTEKAFRGALCMPLVQEKEVCAFYLPLSIAAF